ncbi:phage portal protein [Microbacterium sp. gxy059]|uniref:phage portal protein n=1 Tax=Microbacterium sp. gxy059 TaxID=2957199 RepID=UPI003D9624B3
MPLPDENTSWLPPAFEPYFDAIDTFDDWYVGDVDRLTSAYANKPITHPAQHNGGIVGFGARAWLGKPQKGGENRVRLHIPLPADIATLSADYLFGEAPRVVLPGERGTEGENDRDRMQARVEKIINTPRFHSLLLESGEVSSALGGTYLRLVWNQDDLREVRAEAVHADAAIPTFRYGDLHEVTFFTEYEGKRGVVWRHLEHHSRGRVEHALFEGTTSNLGRRVPLTDRRETEWLSEVVDDDSGLDTGVEGLTAAYIPNMRPNKRFRKDPALTRLGQSDFADITQLFDAIDEVWSSWMRDIRLAKARIVVAKQYLESNGFGQGASFDVDREVYEGMNTITGPGGQDFGFHAHQFNIRVEEHAATIKELRDQAMRSAGWTPGSAGGDATGMRTATEIKADERLSERTRDKKANYWKAGVQEFLLTWLQLDSVLYGGPFPEEPPEFRFPAEAQADQESMARTNQMLYAAQSASIETRVRMQHPDWDGETVNKEVDRIKDEFGIGKASDPTVVRTVDDATTPSQDDIDRMRERMERGDETEDEPDE